METTDLARHVANQIDDVLATIPLVSGNEDLTEHLWEQLVDLLLEGALVELQRQRRDGRLSARAYREALAELAAQCGAAGLLPRS